jgi:hypothetical protein
MFKRILGLNLVLAFALSSSVAAEDRTEFIVKIGVMERAAEQRDRLRPTRTLTMDPSRRPGFCFIVDPPTEDPYEVYSVHSLPAAPKMLTGEFANESTDRAPLGMTTRTEHTEGIRPFCFDFHDGDPIGTYMVRVFINSTLTASFDLEVTEPINQSKQGARP